MSNGQNQSSAYTCILDERGKIEIIDLQTDSDSSRADNEYIRTLAGVGNKLQEDAFEIMEYVQRLRMLGGWGVISLVFKGGDLHEVTTTITDKPKLQRDQGVYK